MLLSSLSVLALVLAVAVTVLGVGLRRARSVLARVEQQARRLGGEVDDAADGVLRAAVDELIEGRDAQKGAQRLSAALVTLPVGVAVCDADARVIFRNLAAEAFTDGQHGDALIEAALGEVLHSAVTGTPDRRQVDLYKPPRRSYVLRSVPLSSPGGPDGALAVIEDVTESRRIDEMRRDFVANISHELKTPVGALTLLAETMLEEEDPHVARRLGERMLGEASRVGRTIDDLLLLSRIESEDTADRDPVPVHLVIAEAVGRTRPGAAQRDVRIDAAEPDHRLSIVGDRRQLVSAVANLLENAVKYSEAGSTVRVAATTDGRTAAVAVTDDGIGIPERDLDRIFERFYRVDTARSRQTGGTGLGLSIVRHVVQNHGGDVTVDSHVGHGSTFTIRLPVASGGPVAVTAEAG